VSACESKRCSLSPIDRLIWLGPFSGISQKANNEHGADDSVKQEDRPGVIKQIVVHEYNEIDFLKFIYEGHEGHGVGKWEGGEHHTVDVPKGKYITRVETWWDSGIGRHQVSLQRRNKHSKVRRPHRHGPPLPERHVPRPPPLLCVTTEANLF
jgi:hypothetical protein